ncbi:MAG: AAA family ATPase, partial [Firmicutes bacterium]|nr:AAA family ATPase [Bacillota bacterium]
KPPRRIAWIQCVGSREVAHNYCSSVCCMISLKEARMARELLPDAELEIFYMDLRTCGKGYERYLEEAKSMGIRMTRGRPSEVLKRKGGLYLQVEEEEGRWREDPFDLVVLATGFEASPETKRLAKILNIPLDQDGFLSPEPGSLSRTSREGVYLAAPTGRASRRMSEATGHEAQTIHKMLGLNEKGEAIFNSGNPLPCSLLIVDETSMADVFVARDLLSAVKDGARVLFVGDADQLPSVGPGNVLKDLMGSVPCVKLNRIFRQAAESSIVVNAHRINSGQMPIFDKTKKDLVFLERETPDEIIECVKTCVKNLPYGPMDVQLIAPMRKGPVGTEELNRAVQGMFSAKELRHNSKVFKEGDKVIHTKNNYAKDVLNGDVGVVEKIYEDGLAVRYNGHVVSYSRDDLKELEPGWAISIHKSQGSEYKAVIIVLSTSHYVMLARNLIYTAITRAKELAIIIGSRKALAMAVRNNKPTQRFTMLKNYLSPV